LDLLGIKYEFGINLRHMESEKINLLYIKISSLQQELDQAATEIARRDETIAKLKAEIDSYKQ